MRAPPRIQGCSSVYLQALACSPLVITFAVSVCQFQFNTIDSPGTVVEACAVHRNPGLEQRLEQFLSAINRVKRAFFHARPLAPFAPFEWCIPRSPSECVFIRRSPATR